MKFLSKSKLYIQRKTQMTMNKIQKRIWSSMNLLEAELTTHKYLTLIH